MKMSDKHTPPHMLRPCGHGLAVYPFRIFVSRQVGLRIVCRGKLETEPRILVSVALRLQDPKVSLYTTIGGQQFLRVKIGKQLQASKNMIMTRLKVPCIHLIVLMSEVLLCYDSLLDIPAIVNENVTLPFNCSGQVVEFAIVYPIKTTIAGCKNWSCEIDEPFKKRFSILGDNSSKMYTVHISSTVYTDSGTYSCISNGVEVSSVKLHIYIPFIVTAFEGENVTLPCVGDTREMAKNVLWMKGGEKVFEYTFGETDEAPAGRFFMSNQSYQEGNLSLSIISTKLTDAGLYRCLFHDESREGDPRAVKLVIKEQEPTNQPDTAPISCTKDTVIAVIFTVIAIVLGRLAVYMVRRKAFCKKTDNTSEPVQEELPLNENKTSTVEVVYN